MTTSNNKNRLKKWLAISLALHIVIIILVLLVTSKKQSDRVFYTPSYKVDLVTIPEAKRAKPKKAKIKKTRASSNKKKKKVAKKTVAKKKVKPSKKKRKVADIDPSKAIERLRKKHAEESAIEEGLAKARARVDKETRDNAAEKAAASRSKSVKKVQNSDIDKELKGYYDTLWNKIKDSWVLPGQADFSGMITVASVIIGSDGKLLDLSIEKGSGNGFFDASTLRAIKKSAPFPPLPDGYEGGLEIGFRFTPDGL